MPTITDWNDLDNIRNDLTADYTLENTLDSTTTGYSGIGDNFTPIPADFSGTFDGQGNEINDLVIKTDGSSLGTGLFETVNGATVENVTLKRALLFDTTENSAVLIGRITGTSTIRNCDVFGDVYAENDSGLLVGSGTTDNTGSTVIEDCYVQGTVRGGINNGSGGLIGRVKQSISITRCGANVSVEDGQKIGGIAGYDDGPATYTDCFARLRATHDSSSYAGIVHGSGFVDVNLSRCWAIAEGGGSTEAAGLATDRVSTADKTWSILLGAGSGDPVDPQDSGTYTDVFFDTDISDPNSSTTPATGLSRANMTGSAAESNMGFDFTNNWYTVEAGQTLSVGDNEFGPFRDSYPVLRGNGDADFVERQLLAIFNTQRSSPTPLLSVRDGGQVKDVSGVTVKKS